MKTPSGSRSPAYRETESGSRWTMKRSSCHSSSSRGSRTRPCASCCEKRRRERGRHYPGPIVDRQLESTLPRRIHLTYWVKGELVQGIRRRPLCSNDSLQLESPLPRGIHFTFRRKRASVKQFNTGTFVPLFATTSSLLG